MKVNRLICAIAASIALASLSFGEAPTSFRALMRDHAAAVKSLSLSETTRASVARLDESFRAAMTHAFEALDKTPANSTARKEAAAKLRSINATYREDLRETLGAAWKPYQQAFARIRKASQPKPKSKAKGTVSKKSTKKRP